MYTHAYIYKYIRIYILFVVSNVVISVNHHESNNIATKSTITIKFFQLHCSVKYHLNAKKKKVNALKILSKISDQQKIIYIILIVLRSPSS